MKWALVAATILSILLSWGKHFMPLTNFFIDFVPMYAKFRTVSSILVIAEFTIPLLAIMALKRLVDEPELIRTRRTSIYLIVSFVLTAGLAWIFRLMPTAFFDFTSTADTAQLSQYVPQEYLAPILDSISKARIEVFKSDCMRSAWIIVIGTVLLFLYKANKLKAPYMVGAILVLCLVDMWQINKRYLYDEMFVDKTVREQPIKMSAAEEQILKDKSLDYRVLNLASNTFNENETSFYLKSIGGYHAAKLRRYQEMIDAYISKEMSGVFSGLTSAQGDITKVNGDSIWPVLNMLNAKYFILPLQSGQTVPVQNPYTYGNAWFVDKVNYVDNANQEIDMVGKLNLRHEAVADKKFAEQLGESVKQDSTSIVTITSYEPNKLVYDVHSDKGGVVVFSEIYYPGWTATVDGEEVELGRVNYILRALNVKPGNHKVELSFFPKSVDITETVAYVAYGILLLVVLFLIFMEWKKRKK